MCLYIVIQPSLFPILVFSCNYPRDHSTAMYKYIFVHSFFKQLFWDLHTIKYTLPKITVQWVLVYLYSNATIVTIQFKNTSIPSCPVAVNPSWYQQRWSSVFSHCHWEQHNIPLWACTIVYSTNPYNPSTSSLLHVSCLNFHQCIFGRDS